MAECTIYDKLRYIAETKDLIKAAIEAQDVKVLESATFRQYAEYITEIRKVSSVNGMQGDVTITAADLGALTEIPSEYITETELNEKGYLTAVPEVYITEDELSSQLADKVSQNGLNEAIDGVRNDIPTNVSQLTNDSGYITLNEVPKVDLSGYALKSEIPDISVKQDKLTAGNGISITDNVISLDYEYDLFEVVQSLPTENISDNKVYLVLDSNGSEGNTYVEYLYVNGQWEELGKFKVNVDLSGYATEDWVNSQGFLKEHQDISNLATKAELATKQDVITDLDSIRSGAALGATALQSVPSEYATEQWVNEQGFLKEHQDISNLATKEELNTKQDVINDLETIRSGAALGATALQAVPDTYATEQWVNEQGFIKEHQDISNLATKEELNTKQDVISDLETIRIGASKGATALQAVPDTYALKTDILSAKTDTRYTTFDVQNPVLSGNTIVLQNEVTDSRKYHTLGYDKTAETTEIVQVIKYSRYDENVSQIIDTNFDNHQPIPLDFSHITDDGDQIIIHYTGSFANNDYEAGTSTEGDSFEATITYNRNTKQLNAIDDANITIYHFTRSDTGEYIFDQNNKELSFYMLPDDAYLIWDIGNMSSPLYYRYNISTQGNLFVDEIATTSPTSRLPQNKNEFFRYENDVKAYILTDKNTTFKTINGQQITGNGNIELATNVDLYNYATKGELSEKQNFIPDLYSIRNGAALGATALQSVPDTYALKSEIKTVNGTSLIGNGNIELATKEELNAKQDVINDLETIRSGAAKGATALQAVPDTYATEQWVNEQGFLKEHQDISNLATKDELNAKQDVITDLETIRSGAALGATSLQSVPDTYALKSEIKTVNGTSLIGNGNIELATKSELNAKQDTISDLETIRSGAALGATALQAVPDTYALKSEIPDITTKQDTLVSGTNIKTINGTSLLGSGNIEVAANVDLSSYATKEELNAKQDTLVSGTNIKTINGTSLLGSGDITIEGGSGNVDLSNYYTKTETNELVNPKLEQVTLTQAEYDALQTKEENVLYIISDAEDLKFKTINGQQILGEGNIEIKASADNVPTVQTTPKGTTSNYIYSTGIFDGYGVISDITNAITYSTDEASIATWKRYWGEESSNSYQSWSINAATTSKAGLMSASDKTKLDGIDLTTKQDVLVSGTNIKTVNGISILGEGNITIEGGSGNVDLSNYYTKTETNELVNPKLEQVTLTQAEYDALSTKEENVLYIISDASTTDSSDYYTKAEIDEMIGGASNTITQINNLVG